MRFSDLVNTSARVSATSKRTEKTAELAALLRRLEPDEVEIAVAYLSGYAPQGKIGIGYRAIQESSRPPAPEPSLEIRDVDRALTELAGVRGSASTKRRVEILAVLMAACTEPEQRFLISLIAGELRQGALEGVMADAVAKASGIALQRVQRAAMMAGDIAPVARAALENGEAGLDQYAIQLFRPVQPMLAQTAEDVGEALGELGDASLEYKMDGARVQVHKSGDLVKVYSRALNEVTGAVPEVVEAARALPAHDLILDGETLSFRPDGRPQPFQVTARRFGRKIDLDRLRAELPMQPFWFDLLYLNGESMLDEAQSRRFGALEEIAPVETVIPHLRTGDADKAEEFVREALERGHEGVMAKSPDSAYAAGARGQSWLKIKQAHTLDLVILAAEWGNGRRQGWLSNLHLGARDTEKGGFQMLGKTFKGLTDEMLAWQTEQFQKIEIGRDKYTVYVEPRIVAEIAFNDVQISSRYSSGLALRFARVKRYRPDKPASEADTYDTVRRLAGL